jgi:hypothetical protein
MADIFRGPPMALLRVSVVLRHVVAIGSYETSAKLITASSFSSALMSAINKT